MAAENIAGTWVFFQKWDNVPEYKFTVTISSAGVVTVAGGFIGIVTQFPNTYLSIAITNPADGSVTSYLGNVVGKLMGGEITGTDKSGKVYKGIWHAQHQTLLEVAEKEFGIGQ